MRQVNSTRVVEFSLRYFNAENDSYAAIKKLVLANMQYSPVFLLCQNNKHSTSITPSPDTVTIVCKRSTL